MKKYLYVRLAKTIVAPHNNQLSFQPVEWCHLLNPDIWSLEKALLEASDQVGSSTIHNPSTQPTLNQPSTPTSCYPTIDQPHPTSKQLLQLSTSLRLLGPRAPLIPHRWGSRPWWWCRACQPCHQHPRSGQRSGLQVSWVAPG